MPNIEVMTYRPGSTGNAIVNATATLGTLNIYVAVGAGSEPSDPTTSVNNGTIVGHVGEVASTVNVDAGDDAHIKARAQSEDGVLGPVAYNIFERPSVSAAISDIDFVVYLESDSTNPYSTGATYEYTWSVSAAVTTDMSVWADHYKLSSADGETALYKGSTNFADATTGTGSFVNAAESTTLSDFYITLSLLSSSTAVIDTKTSIVKEGDIAPA